MGCHIGCMNGKLNKIFTSKALIENGKKIANDFKILLVIIDFLPLDSLMYSSRTNRQSQNIYPQSGYSYRRYHFRRFYFVAGRKSVLQKFHNKNENIHQISHQEQMRYANISEIQYSYEQILPTDINRSSIQSFYIEGLRNSILDSGSQFKKIAKSCGRKQIQFNQQYDTKIGDSTTLEQVNTDIKEFPSINSGQILQEQPNYIQNLEMQFSQVDRIADFIRIENQEVQIVYDNVTDQIGLFKPQFILFNDQKKHINGIKKSATKISSKSIGNHSRNLTVSHLPSDANNEYESGKQSSLMEQQRSVQEFTERKRRKQLMMEIYSEEQGSQSSQLIRKTPKFLLSSCIGSKMDYLNYYEDPQIGGSVEDQGPFIECFEQSISNSEHQSASLHQQNLSQFGKPPTIIIKDVNNLMIKENQLEEELKQQKKLSSYPKNEVQKKQSKNNLLIRLGSQNGSGNSGSNDASIPSSSQSKKSIILASKHYNKKKDLLSPQSILNEADNRAHFALSSNINYQEYRNPSYY